jgi:hypothetical protein
VTATKWWAASRGAALTKKTIHERWWDSWPELNALEHPVSGVHFINLDPFQVAADLYITEGIMFHAFTEQAPSLLDGKRLAEVIAILRLTDEEVREGANDITSLIMAAHTAQEKLIRKAFPVLYAYTEAAIGGELRWGAPALGGFSRKEAWCAWRHIVEHYGPEIAYNGAREDFLLLGLENGGVGGEAWAAVADTVLAYTRSTKDLSAAKIFIDRVLSLEHNGGSLLDKREWLLYPPRVVRKDILCGIPVWQLEVGDSQSIGRLDLLLDCHASDPPDVDGLNSCASNEVQQLLHEYREAVAHLVPIASWSE